MGQHTPGPWQAGFAGDVWINTALINGRWSEVPGKRPIIIASLSGFGLLPEEVEANRRLIAAAPEMFEALRRIAEQKTVAELAAEGLTDADPNARDEYQEAYDTLIGIARAALHRATASEEG